MKKFLRKATKAFRNYAADVFSGYGQQVTAAVENAIALFPNPIPALVDINKELANYASLLKTAASRDKEQVALKGQSRIVLNGMLSELTDYINLIAQGDEGMLAASSMTLSKVPAEVTIKAPTSPVLSDGVNTGEMRLKFKKSTGATSSLFQYSTDPAMSAATTVSIPSSKAKYTFTGLTKGTTYYCRGASVGGRNQVAYTIIVNRICQ
jgi:hypothetical protein